MKIIQKCFEFLCFFFFCYVFLLELCWSCYWSEFGICDPPPRNESQCAKPTFAVARNLLQLCENVDFDILVVDFEIWFATTSVFPSSCFCQLKTHIKWNTAHSYTVYCKVSYKHPSPSLYRFHSIVGDRRLLGTCDYFLATKWTKD